MMFDKRLSSAPTCIFFLPAFQTKQAEFSAKTSSCWEGLAVPTRPRRKAHQMHSIPKVIANLLSAWQDYIVLRDGDEALRHGVL